MIRCPKCNGLNVHSFTSQEAHSCYDCRHLWGKDADKKRKGRQIEREVEAAFPRLFDNENQAELSRVWEPTFEEWIACPHCTCERACKDHLK